jgi:hypothetical protein
MFISLLKSVMFCSHRFSYSTPGRKRALVPTLKKTFHKIKNINILISHAIQEAGLGPNPENFFLYKMKNIIILVPTRCLNMGIYIVILAQIKVLRQATKLLQHGNVYGKTRTQLVPNETLFHRLLFFPAYGYAVN